MRQNIRPQLVDALGVGFARKLRHMRLKRGRHLRQMLCKAGPIAVLRSLILRIKRLSVAVIGVHQSREQHPRGDRNIKSKMPFPKASADQRQKLCPQITGRADDFLLPVWV